MRMGDVAGANTPGKQVERCDARGVTKSVSCSQPHVDAADLGENDADTEGHPEEGGDLLEVVDGGAGDLGVEEEARALDLLADEETERGEHGDAAVGDLHVGETLCLSLVDVVVEAEGIDTVSEGSTTLSRREQRRGGQKARVVRGMW